MNVGRSLLVGAMMLGGSLVAVQLTASAVQIVAMQAEGRKIAAWKAAEVHQVSLPPPKRASNIVEAALR